MSLAKLPLNFVSLRRVGELTFNGGIMLNQKLFYLLVTSIALPTMAHGDLSGTWSGGGDRCSVRFSVKQTPDSLEIGKRNYQCGKLVFSLPAVVFEVQDEQVYVGDTSIGYSKSDIIKISTTNLPGEASQSFTLAPKEDEKKASFWESSESKKADFSFEGNVSKQ
jgi:hypothetical protein